MQIKWETLQKEALQLLPCLTLPSQSLILIVRSKGNFVLPVVLAYPFSNSHLDQLFANN